jgi:hypothetical protein
MKRITILNLLCVFLFSACKTCDIYLNLGNSKKKSTDIEDYSNEKPYGIRFGVQTGKDVYSNDTLEIAIPI